MEKDLNWLKEKIKECEAELEKNKISIATANEYEKLLEIHSQLFELLYFKTHREETFLLK